MKAVSKEIESLLKLYDYSPSLILYGNILNSDLTIEKRKIFEKISNLIQEELNPIDVVLESLVNVISEDISRRNWTHSEDKVLIDNKIRNHAVKVLLEIIDNDKEKLKMLHKIWMQMLTEFLKEIHQQENNVNIDKVIFIVSERFRTSSLSAIRAITSILKNEK